MVGMLPFWGEHFESYCPRTMSSKLTIISIPSGVCYISKCHYDILTRKGGHRNQIFHTWFYRSKSIHRQLESLDLSHTHKRTLEWDVKNKFLAISSVTRLNYWVAKTIFWKNLSQDTWVAPSIILAKLHYLIPDFITHCRTLFFWTL